MKVGQVIASLSLQTRLIVSAVFVLALACGIACYYTPSQYELLLGRYALNEYRLTALWAAQKLGPAMRQKDQKTREDILATIGKSDDVSYVVIEKDTEVISSINLPLAESEVFREQSRDFDLFGVQQTYKMRLPLEDKGEEFGYLSIGFAIGDLRSELHSLREFLLIVCGSVFALGVILIGVIAIKHARRLRAVFDVADRATKGDYLGRTNISAKDRTGQLANAVNSIIMNTEATTKRLDALAAIVTKRDAQLKEEEENRKLIEREVQLTNDILHKVSALILVADSEGRIEYASASFERVLGYKPEALLNDGWWRAGEQGDSDVIERMRERNRIAKCARRELAISGLPYERQILDAKGNIRWILWQDTAGFNNRLIAVGQDITQRKLAEEQIREQAALLEITGDAIIVRTLDHKVLYWNRGAESLYGVARQDAIGNSVSTLIENDDDVGSGLAYTTVIENGSWSGELKQVAKGGKKITVESRWTLMSDEKGAPKSILVVNTDVTEQRYLEVQFRRTQRLENIGTLAGGIAHDLNNVLTPILMSIQALQLRHTDERSQQVLSTIEMSARRGADIVKQVLTFARGTEGERTLLQPKHIIREIEKITKETFPRSITLSFEVPANLWTITGDATQLHQIVLNLLVNARDAMPDGGKLRVVTENVSLTDEQARLYLNARAGNYVVLSVSDSGTGIPPEIQDKIFDPFFTTKEVGKGTGLGLSTVMAIVKSYGGFITLNSTMGKGTEFRVHIPATNAEVASSKEDGREGLPVGRGESILVVDDELSIREIMKETLGAYNYRIQTAKDGIEALTMLERQKFDLVITDMMMPTMDGASLIRTLERMLPDVKVIAVSGITDHDALEKIKKSRIEAFLPKPIQADHLLKIIDSILHSEEGVREGLAGAKRNGRK